MILRDYQVTAVDSTVEALRSHNSALLVAPTGGGKTVMFAKIIEHFAASGRVLVMAHSDLLLKQAADKIATITGLGVDWEKANRTADTGMLKAPVVVTSYQTQISGRGLNRRMHRANPHEFILLLIDEAHRSMARSYRQIIEFYQTNPSIKILGVTATPNRADGLSLGQIYETVSFQMDLNDAIEKGWLVNVRGITPMIEGYDISHVKTQAGDLAPGQTAVVLEDKKVLEGMAGPIFERAGDLKTIVFALRVQQAAELSAVLNSKSPGCSRYIDGKMPWDARDEVIRDYRAGKFQFLVNVQIATEGFDVPDIGCVALCRPSKSLPFVCQCLGRGMRPLDGLVDGGIDAADRKRLIEESDKPDLLLIDFCGNFGKHRIMTGIDALAGNHDDETIELANRAMAGTDEAKTLSSVLLDAKIAKIERYEERLAREAERAVELRSVGVRAKYGIKQFNPFTGFEINVPHHVKGERGRLPTSGQVAALEKFGVENIDRLTFAEASSLMDTLVKRIKTGMCTYKQAKLLRKHGYDPKEISKDEASKIIGQLMQGWRRKGGRRAYR